MGVGDPLEAAYELSGPIGAGTWHLIGDGVVLRDVEMRFEVLARGTAGEKTIVTFDHRFEVPSGPDAFRAVAFEADQTGAAVEDAELLVLRMTATSTKPGPAFIPNADDQYSGGRIPSITLP